MKFINKIFLVAYILVGFFLVHATSYGSQDKIADIFLNICVFSVDDDEDAEVKNSSSTMSLKEEFKNILLDVLKTKSGYILICKILEIINEEKNIDFSQCVSELDKFNGIVDISQFEKKYTNLNTKIFEKVIISRNQAICKKIMFRKSKEGYFSEPTENSEPLTLYYRVKNINVLGISKTGKLEKIESKPDIGLFHELLHLYHYIKNPIITNYFKLFNFDIKDDATETNNIKPILKIQKYDLKAYQQYADNSPIGFSLEEMLTIRGKPKTMYELSENSYRANQKNLLRFSHIALSEDGDVNEYRGYYNIDNHIDNHKKKTDNKEISIFNGKDIYEAYYERAYGGKSVK